MKLSSNYRNAFEQNCFRLIIKAFKTSITEKVIQLDWNENDVSYELYEIMEHNPLRTKKYKIHLSPEFRTHKNIQKVKGFADMLPRIDLRMSHFALKKEFKCFFEAKRIKEKDSVLKRAYISEGMNRFIFGKYPTGCMVGYLIEGNLGKTITGINSLLIKDGRGTETLKSAKNKLFKSYYESNHSGIGILKHLVFDFTY